MAEITETIGDTTVATPERSSIPSRRDQGDGSATPRQTLGEVSTKRKLEKPFSYMVEIDFMQWILFICAIFTRMWKLDTPKSINFDEMHFGRYAAMYLKNTFFFDIHPPLGKLLFALAGHHGDFDPEFKFEKIGGEYPASVPIWNLRFFPAFFSSLTVPVIYQLMIELKCTRWTALLAATLFILENSLIVHARCTVMEGMIVFFVFLAILASLKMRTLTKSEAFSLSWWTWMVLLGIALGCAPSIKYSGLLGVMLVYVLEAKFLWSMLSDITFSDRFIAKYVFGKFFICLLMPLCIYMSTFYTHLSLLTKAGPNDDVMTSAFQASLEGGLAAITRGQPLEIAYGSQLTLRRTYGASPCWLHSHNHTYPLRYPDKRGSSYQQQITCYNFKDVNNWWIVKHPNRSNTFVSDPPEAVKDGDIIQLVHGMTSRLLNSHNVAAPLSPTKQEVSCFMDWKVNATLYSLWKVQIVNKDTEGDTWKTIKSHIRLVHVNTSQALRNSGKLLPEWGFFQGEMVTDKEHHHDSGIFNVEEHRYSQNTSEDSQKEELMKAKLLPMKPIQMSFWSKFWELQTKMFMSKHDSDLEHKYSSSPYDWPLFGRNIAYWMSSKSNAQIHLICNIMIWYSGAVAVCVFLAILIFHLMRRRRVCYDISEECWEQFVLASEILFAGYLLHYMPYLLADRTMFIYSYLPALSFQILLMSFLVEHIHSFIWSSAVKVVYVMLVVVWVTAVFNVFIKFLPVTYGFKDLTQPQIQELRWKQTWDFLYVKR